MLPLWVTATAAGQELVLGVQEARTAPTMGAGKLGLGTGKEDPSERLPRSPC